MNRWELIDQAPLPDEGRELRLYRRGDEFSIRVTGEGELMSSRTHGSEDALGELVSRRVRRIPRARLLIGGLGMGFTLAAALERLEPDSEVLVAELVPGVVRWNREYLGHCAGHPLSDARVVVREGDVARVLRGARDAFDAIALDVDNGPEGLTRRANDRLYSMDGLTTAYRALRVGGTLAVWSAGPDRTFTARLHQMGFEVEERRVRAHGRKGARHVIWLARRAA